MSSGKDWIPHSDEEFAGFFEQYAITVSRNTSGAEPVWTHIPADRVALKGAWHRFREFPKTVDRPYISVCATKTRRAATKAKAPSAP
jgi:hypothetical protein